MSFFEPEHSRGRLFRIESLLIHGGNHGGGQETACRSAGQFVAKARIFQGQSDYFAGFSCGRILCASRSEPNAIPHRASQRGHPKTQWIQKAGKDIGLPLEPNFGNLEFQNASLVISGDHQCFGAVFKDAVWRRCSQDVVDQSLNGQPGRSCGACRAECTSF